MSLLLGHTQDWHDERRKGLGGSDAKTIMAGEWTALWEEKTGRSEPEDLSRIIQVQLGSFTEAFNLAWFEQETGMAVSTDDCDGLVHAERDFMRANLDGRANGGIVEAKHTAAWAKDEEIVSRYYPQVQHCMVVAGLPRTYLSVIFGNNRWQFFPIEADEEFQDSLIRLETEFWGYVEADECPPNVAGQSVDIAFDDLIEVEMTGNNEWAANAADWLDCRDHARDFKTADKGLKELTPADAKRAFGYGIEINRSRNGALRIKEMK